MKKSELIKLLSSMDEEEVFIEIEDVQYEIELSNNDEVFDGFETFYPASISIKAKK